MSTIEFDEPNFAMSSNTKTQENKPSKLMMLPIRLGLAKNERQASTIMLSVAITGIVAAIIILLSALRESPINYNMRPEILETLPEDIQKNINNANR